MPKPNVTSQASADKKLPPPSGKKQLARPRKRTDAGEFDFRRDSKTRGGVSDDNLCFARDAPPITVVQGRWNGELPLVFRAFPAIDPNDCETFLHARKSDQDNDFTDWMRGLPAISFTGIDRQITCLLYDPRWKLSKGYNPRENPYNILHYEIKDVVKEFLDDKKGGRGEALLGRKNVFNPKWIKYMKNNLKCAPDNQAGFFQGAVYQNDDRIYVAGGKPPLGLGPEDNPVIIMVPKSNSFASSGMFALRKVLNLRPENKPDSDDLTASFIHGNPTGIADGRFLTVHNPKKHLPKLDLLSGADSGEADAGGDEVEYETPGEEDAEGGKDSDGMRGWEMSAYDVMYYFNKGKRRKARLDLTEYEDRIRQQYLWWDDLLHFPETAELCLWLAQAFRSVPNLLLYGWRDNPEFFTDEVKGVLAARTQGPGAEIPGDDDEDGEDEGESKPSRGRRTSALLADDEQETKPSRKPKTPVDEDEGFEDDDSTDDEDDGENGEDDDGFDDEDDDGAEVEVEEEEAGDEDAEDGAEGEESEEDARVREAAAAAKTRAAQRNSAAGNTESAAPEDSDMAAKKGNKPASTKKSGKKKPVATKKKK